MSSGQPELLCLDFNGEKDYAGPSKINNTPKECTSKGNNCTSII